RRAAPCPRVENAKMYEWVEPSEKRAALPAPSQLSGDFQAEGPRLTRREVVVAIRRGPIALLKMFSISPGKDRRRRLLGVASEATFTCPDLMSRKVLCELLHTWPRLYHLGLQWSSNTL